MNNLPATVEELINLMRERGYDSLGLAYDPEMMIGISDAAKARFLKKYDPKDLEVWKDSLQKFKNFFIDSTEIYSKEVLERYDESRSMLESYLNRVGD